MNSIRTQMAKKYMFKNRERYKIQLRNILRREESWIILDKDDDNYAREIDTNLTNDALIEFIKEDDSFYWLEGADGLFYVFLGREGLRNYKIFGFDNEEEADEFIQYAHDKNF